MTKEKYTNQAQVPSVRFCDVCKFIVPSKGPCEQCWEDANEAFACEDCGSPHDEAGYGYKDDGGDCLNNPDLK